jgi:hypothetical protein
MAKGVRVPKLSCRRAWFVVVWSIAACASNEQVLLGHEKLPQLRDAGFDSSDAASPAPSRAPGFGTGDTPFEPPTIPTPTALVEVAEPGRCDGLKVESKLSIDWIVDDSGDDCTGASCGVNLDQIAPQADQSVWALWQIADHGRLQHVDASRTVLGSARVPTPASFAVDDHGVAWLTTQPSSLGNEQGASLRRFDGSVTELTAPSDIHDVGAVAAVPGHGVALATLGAHPAVTLLDFEGKSLWSRDIDASPNGPVHITVGRSLIMVLHEVTREPAYMGIVSQDFDYNGALVGRRESSVNLSVGAYPGHLRSALDSDSDLVLGVMPPDPRGGTFLERVGVVDIESIDASGNSRWALRLSSTVVPAVALALNGDVWVAQLQPADLGVPQQPDTFLTNNIARVSRDGRTCRLFSYQGIWLQTLETASDGTLWFAANTSYGRFSPNMP